jgi:phage terminase Nu1 subunit (DNA packaging protein)
LQSSVTQKVFGEIVGISQPAVSDLIKRDVLAEGDTLANWIIAYCSNLREQAAGRAGADGGLDLVSERARLAKEQADKVAYQNAITRNQLAPVDLLEEVLAKAAAKINGVFDAIPGMIKRRVPTLSSEEIDLIALEISRGRNIVASMSLHDIDEQIAVDDEPVDFIEHE